MTDIHVEAPEETPADDTTIVVAPTIVVDAGATDEAPAEEAVEEVVETVVEETVDLAVLVGGLSERVTALEIAAVTAPPADAGDTIIVEEEGPGDVVIDTSPSKVPWTHRNPFKGRD